MYSSNFQDYASERIGDTKSSYTVDQQKCPWKNCNDVPCRKPWHKPCSFANSELVPRLRSLVLFIGLLELFVGALLSILMMIYSADYDRMYGTKDTNSE